MVFDYAYHGRTNLTMAMTAKNVPYKQGFGPFAGEVYRAPMSYPFREPAPITGRAAADRAITMIDKAVGAGNVACVVIEPILGEGGFVVPADGFLPRLAEWCNDNGVVFVADEIQTGFCRTGSWFAQDHEGVVPDMITTAKGIAGGLPLAGDRACGDHGLGEGWRSGRYVRRQPGGMCSGDRLDHDHARSRPGWTSAPHRRADDRPPDRDADELPDHRRRTRSRGNARDRARRTGPRRRMPQRRQPSTRHAMRKVC